MARPTATVITEVATFTPRSASDRKGTSAATTAVAAPPGRGQEQALTLVGHPDR
jgi:hypothetical protein